MSRPILLVLALLLMLGALPARARTLQARIERIDSAVATLDGVTVRLDWPARADHGALLLTARALDAVDLGYHYRDLRWACRLQRATGGWRCDGAVSGLHGAPLRLAVDLQSGSTDIALARSGSVLSVHRLAATPDDTSVDLTRVPLAWAQALLAQAWPDGRLKSGTLDGTLLVHAPSKQPLQVRGKLAVAGASFDTPDATKAGEGLAGNFDIDYRKTPLRTQVRVDGQLRGGEFLVGNAYVQLPATPVSLQVQGIRDGDQGWQFPRFDWNDGSSLVARGRAGFDRDANLQDLDVNVHARDLAAVPARYLSGWLALSGLGDLQLSGSADARLRMSGGTLQSATLDLQGVDMVDAKGRFRFEGLGGSPTFAASGPVSSELRWSGGQLYGLDFGASTLPIDSGDGSLRLRDAVTVPALGGSLRFDHLTLQPPAGGTGLRLQFGLTLDRLDIGKLATALHWPAFQGVLSGRIPTARYADERLDFDGGLSMQLFDGQVDVSALSMERPFGVAPSLSADLALHHLDLQALTGVFDFGSITGRLDGRIDRLRLVDWTATAFDAELHTVPTRGIKQRISQRAVQNISSVGDASFTNTLQSQLIGLFNDFGYSHIGIACRLANEVCEMGGLQPTDNPDSPAGFTIVEGSGLPHLTVVGFHRRVDWPTLLERLSAVSKGEVKPVVQ